MFLPSILLQFLLLFYRVCDGLRSKVISRLCSSISFVAMQLEALQQLGMFHSPVPSFKVTMALTCLPSCLQLLQS